MAPMQFGFGVPGGMELAVILLIAILLFGANKIPKLARSTGQAIGEFRRGREEIEQELQDLQGGAEVNDSPADSTTAAGSATDDAGAESSATDASATDGGESVTDETDESK